MRQVLEQMGVGGLQVCAVEPALDGGFVELADSKAYKIGFAFLAVLPRRFVAHSP